MKKEILLATIVLSLSQLASNAFAATASDEDIFKTKCASCHPNGGNIINPKNTLKGIKDSKKILSKIRNGGGGMPAFDTKSISDAYAKQLAEYIISKFK